MSWSDDRRRESQTRDVETFYLKRSSAESDGIDQADGRQDSYADDPHVLAARLCARQSLDVFYSLKNISRSCDTPILIWSGKWEANCQALGLVTPAVSRSLAACNRQITIPSARLLVARSALEPHAPRHATRSRRVRDRHLINDPSDARWPVVFLPLVFRPATLTNTYAAPAPPPEYQLAPRLHSPEYQIIPMRNSRKLISQVYFAC